jgi:HSP20 family protein
MKSLVPWKRRPGEDLRARFDRLFDQFFADPWGRGWVPEFFGGGRGETLLVPAVDVRETDSHVIVRAELPGVDAKEVELELLENTLHLSGRKEERREGKEGEAGFPEFRYGAFRREISLPAEVDSDAVKATFENGILTVELKKSKVSRARKISVEAR